MPQTFVLLTYHTFGLTARSLGRKRETDHKTIETVSCHKNRNSSVYSLFRLEDRRVFTFIVVHRSFFGSCSVSLDSLGSTVDRCSKIENQQKDSRSLITKMYRPVVSEIGSPLIMN